MAARHTRSQEGNGGFSMNGRVPRARNANAKPAARSRVGKKLAKSPPKKRRRTLKPIPRTYHPGPLIEGEATLAAGVAALLEQDAETIKHMLEVGGTTP